MGGTSQLCHVTMKTIWKNTVERWPISQLCYVTMETIWKNTGGFVDGRY